MDHFTLLPHDLHRTLFNHYLLYREKMSLISCNTTFYGLYFKKERIITLSEINNYKFFYDLGFQQMVLEKIDSPLDQLIMYDHDFSFIFIKDHFFVPRLNGIKTLFIPIDDYVKLNELYPDCIPVVENLFLGPSNRFEFIEGERVLPFLNRAKKSIKFSSLRNLPVELTLSPTIEEVYFDNCNAVNKLSSPLPNLRIMKLSQSCVQNLNDFNDLEELTFDEAQVSAMINHSTLSTARKLQFEKWKNLSDISFLQENEEIIISDCSQVTNYTNCFRKSKKITIDLTTEGSIAVDVDIDVDLSYYSKVEEFRLLGNGIVLTNGLATGIISPTLKLLDVSGVCGITDLELFGHLKYISLINCPDITTLRGLEHVPSVTVKGLALTNLEGLGANKEVIISRCNHVTDFTPLKYVNRVNIESCEGFTNASHLDHVSNVTIFSCDQLEDVSGLRNAESVNLFLCPLITDFSPLKYVDSVKLVKCKGFTNASHLDHVSHVTIWYGDQLEDVSGLRNAESVELGICPLIKSIESLKDVKKLKVWGCELLNC